MVCMINYVLIENIEVTDDNARKNKNKKYGINKHDKNRTI